MDASTTGSSPRERRRRLLFEAALQLPTSDRLAFLKTQTASDEELLASVLGLLAADDAQTQGVLDKPVHRRRPQADPQAIGNCRVLRRLGAGGMADVYRCEAPDGAQVAVKVLRPVLSDQARQAFERECSILKRLKHPNVCQIIDAGVEQGVAYIVMELVEGERADHFCRSRDLGLAETLLLFSRVLAGVDYVHRQEIIHRDLKPANILVTGGGLVKILDFGVAKFAEHRAGLTGSQPTSSRDPAFTVRYASPEQLSGRLSGRSSDIYSLGVVLYELLTGRHPFAEHLGGGIVELLQAMMQRAPLRPSVLRPGVPAATAEFVDALALQALDRDLGRRYRSVERFLADLAQCLGRVQ